MSKHFLFDEDPLVHRQQKKADRRKKKKSTRMKVSGKNVLKLQRIMRGGSGRRSGKGVSS